MIQLVTFHDENMTRAAELCARSAVFHGFDRIKVWSKSEYECLQICQDNERIFQQPKDPRRAWGWWVWKPDIIRMALESVEADDFVVYADAGIEFVNDVGYIINHTDQDLFLFGNNWQHAHWCKRDAVEAVWPRSLSWQDFGNQVQASVVVVRKSRFSQQFVSEWLQWCLHDKGRLVDDSPSILPNHPEFQEHRHDQAILTTLAYKRHIRLHYWPASYNDGAFQYEKQDQYQGDHYPVIFNHHRKRNHEFNKAA